MSTGYLEDRALCFTEVTKHNNTSFDRKVVEDKHGKEDGKEAVTDSEDKTSKKKAQRKAKRDAARAQALLLADIPGLSAPTSTFVPVPRWSAAVPGSSIPTSASIPVPGLSIAVPESSAAVLGLSVTVPELSATVLDRLLLYLRLFLCLDCLLLFFCLRLYFLGYPLCFFLHCLCQRHQRPIWSQEDEN